MLLLMQEYTRHSIQERVSYDLDTIDGSIIEERVMKETTKE